MKHINAKIIAGLIVHPIIALSMFGNPEPAYHVGGYILLILWVVNIIGAITVVSDNPVLGAKIFLYSSIPFVPIGLIGIVGCRNIIEKINKEKFFNDNPLNNEPKEPV